jgi:hypothetical protein
MRQWKIWWHIPDEGLGECKYAGQVQEYGSANQHQPENYDDCLAKMTEFFGRQKHWNLLNSNIRVDFPADEWEKKFQRTIVNGRGCFIEVSLVKVEVGTHQAGVSPPMHCFSIQFNVRGVQMPNDSYSQDNSDLDNRATQDKESSDSDFQAWGSDDDGN